jgi:hypothetical protein
MFRIVIVMSIYHCQKSIDLMSFLHLKIILSNIPSNNFLFRKIQSLVLELLQKTQHSETFGAHRIIFSTERTAESRSVVNSNHIPRVIFLQTVYFTSGELSRETLFQRFPRATPLTALLERNHDPF